ncbi:antitoxin VbhA family protein [Haemophilus parahaemolyticus]|uniref:antitoxin VbhA family protein n=1 Tax=Haemophilus parahaemolyticus TaxID=735 RepID=UPI002492B834|nr:antitoxin VbhA family protein [Haemophilus parahaemolyticus]
MHTASEKQQRQEAVQFAINNNAIEGLFVSEQTKQLLNRWIEGELTLEQVESKIYALWQ